MTTIRRRGVEYRGPAARMARFTIHYRDGSTETATANYDDHAEDVRHSLVNMGYPEDIKVTKDKDDDGI